MIGMNLCHEPSGVVGAETVTPDRRVPVPVGDRWFDASTIEGDGGAAQ